MQATHSVPPDTQQIAFILLEPHLEKTPVVGLCHILHLSYCFIDCWIDLFCCLPRQVRIVRIFNTYGPKMALDDGRVVSNFVAQALTEQPITVYGDGQQTRSFQYVDDLIAGMVAVMDGDEIGPFNIGNPGEFTMLELANVSGRSVCHVQKHSVCL